MILRIPPQAENMRLRVFFLVLRKFLWIYKTLCTNHIVEKSQEEKNGITEIYRKGNKSIVSIL